MLIIVAFALSFVASTLAYMVTSPTKENVWSNAGSQVVAWNRVNTDRLNFTILLTNQQLPGFQTQTLANLVQVASSSTLSGSTKVTPPSGGWAPGSNYRVDLVAPDQEDTILAQSENFNITGSSTTSSSTSTGDTSGNGSSATATGSDTSGTATGTSSGTSSISFATDTGTSTSILPTSAAVLSYPVQTSLLGLFSLLGFALA